MKKIVKILIIVSIAFGLCACGLSEEGKAKPIHFRLFGEWKGVYGNYLYFNNANEVEVGNRGTDQLLTLSYSYDEDNNLVEIYYKKETIKIEIKNNEGIYYLSAVPTEVDDWNMAMDNKLPLYVKEENIDYLVDAYKENIMNNYKEVKVGDSFDCCSSEINSMFTIVSLDKYKLRDNDIDLELMYNLDFPNDYRGVLQLMELRVASFASKNYERYGLSSYTTNDNIFEFHLYGYDNEDKATYLLFDVIDSDTSYYLDLSEYMN